MYRKLSDAGEFLLQMALFLREVHLMLAFSVFHCRPQIEGYLLGKVRQNFWLLLLCFFPCEIQISYFLPIFYFSQPASSVSFRHIRPKFSLFLEKNKTEYLPNTIFIGELQIYLNVEDKIINVVEKL